MIVLNNPMLNDLFKSIRLDNEESISGKVWESKISITNNEGQLIKDFKMLAVESTTLKFDSSTQWSGVVGLLPSNK